MPRINLIASFLSLFLLANANLSFAQKNPKYDPVKAQREREKAEAKAKREQAKRDREYRKEEAKRVSAAKKKCKSYFNTKDKSLKKAQKYAKGCKNDDLYELFSPDVDIHNTKNGLAYKQSQFINYNNCIDKMQRFASEDSDFIILCANNKESFRSAVLDNSLQSCLDNSKPIIGTSLAYSKCKSYKSRSLFKSTKALSCIQNIKQSNFTVSVSLDFCQDYSNISISHNESFPQCIEKIREFSLPNKMHLERCDTTKKIDTVTKLPYNACVKILQNLSLTSGIKSFEHCEDSNLINRSIDKHFPSCVSKLNLISIKGTDIIDQCLDNKVFSVTKDLHFSDCTKNLASFGKSQFELLNYCGTSEQVKTAIKSDFISCTNQLISLKINNTKSIDNCFVDSIRETESFTKLTKCIGTLTKFEKRPDNSIDNCKIPSIIQASLTSTFNSCMEAFNRSKLTEYNINACTHHHTQLNNINTESLNKCLVKSRKSAQGEYFSDVAMKNRFEGEQDSNFNANPYTPVLSNCIEDQVPTENKNKTTSKLKLIQDFHFSSNFYSSKNYKKLGGLSALSFDQDSKNLYALSDGFGNYNKPTIFEFELEQTGDIFSLKEKGITTLNTISHNNPDPEGFARLKNGNFVLSTESGVKNENQFINIYNSWGSWKEEITVPDNYTGKNYRNGFQFNRGIEALSVSPSEEIVAAGNEEPLKQDLNYQGQDLVRITLFKMLPVPSKSEKDDENDKTDDKEQKKQENAEPPKEVFTAYSQIAYPLDSNVGNGLSEIMFINENEMLTLERGFNPHTGKVTAKIYKISLNNATNVLELESLHDTKKNIKTVTKKLLLKLDDTLPLIAAGFRKIDNLEGMALGPKLSNGNQTLIMVSDNNFSDRQFTQFLIFEITP